MQGALSPLPDWKGDVLVDTSRQAWFEQIPSLLAATCSIDQPEKRNSVIFEAPSVGADRTEGEPLSPDYHRG
jgi:hypothetical protein